jgi:hypothetical protein
LWCSIARGSRHKNEARNNERKETMSEEGEKRKRRVECKCKERNERRRKRGGEKKVQSSLKSPLYS